MDKTDATMILTVVGVFSAIFLSAFFLSSISDESEKEQGIEYMQIYDNCIAAGGQAGIFVGDPHAYGSAYWHTCTFPEVPP